MTTTTHPTIPRGGAARSRRGSARQAATRVEVPRGISAEEARRVLSAVASNAGTVIRTGRPMTLDLKPATGRSAARFLLVRSGNIDTQPPSASLEGEDTSLSPSAARAALKHAYVRGAAAAAEMLSGPDMLSSDEIALQLGVSREAVHQKRRRGELLGVEGARRGVRFPVWQLGPDGLPLPALKELHEALGEPWAVLRFLRQRHPELGMLTGLQAVLDPARAARVVVLARDTGAFGPAGA